MLQRIIRATARRLKLGSYQYRYRTGAVDRPNYAYLVYQAAQLATRLREPKVSILEFGVAGGNGLITLERHAEEIEKLFPVKIEIYGFDSGAGLPPPRDFRDLPYQWKPGFFRIDASALETRLRRAKLIIGNVEETVGRFVKDHHPAPIGSMSQDLDFYSSTAAALRIFDAGPAHFLPRVFCYFDDTLGGDMELYNDFTGERLAINEFNATHESTKLCPIYYLQAIPNAPDWHHQMWSAHFFAHPKYNTFISAEDQQLRLVK